MYEPACGHAAFLTAAMRDIRNWSGMDDSTARHAYLREHIRGIDIDPVCRWRTTKLSLTLADVPYGNKWKVSGDMFAPGVLRGRTVMGDNGPVEPAVRELKKTGANRYPKSAEPVTARTKAVEMLKRVVRISRPEERCSDSCYLRERSTTGSETVRQEILRGRAEIAEISLFEASSSALPIRKRASCRGVAESTAHGVSGVMYRTCTTRTWNGFVKAEVL